jgi:hypothetical protein
MVKMRLLVENNTSATTMLMDMMGQKSMTKISAEEAKKAREENNNQMDDLPFDLDISYDKSDTKDILGHKCYKAIFKIKPKKEEDAKQMEEVDLDITAYVTSDIQYPKAMLKSYEEAMGTKWTMTDFPLEFSIKFNDGKNNGKVTLAATEIKKTIDASTFKLDTTGYTEMSMEDMMKQGGGF